MAIKWNKSKGNFCESKDGHWRIVPLYCGTTRAQAYELWRDDHVISSFLGNQKTAKEAAEQILAQETKDTAEISNTAKELAGYLNYAKMVSAVLPVDPEADRMAAKLMAAHHRAQGPGRKLKVKDKK
jgi:hypothetical protein